MAEYIISPSMRVFLRTVLKDVTLTLIAWGLLAFVLCICMQIHKKYKVSALMWYDECSSPPLNTSTPSCSRKVRRLSQLDMLTLHNTRYNRFVTKTYEEDHDEVAETAPLEIAIKSPPTSFPLVSKHPKLITACQLRRPRTWAGHELSPLKSWLTSPKGEVKSKKKNVRFSETNLCKYLN